MALKKLNMLTLPKQTYILDRLTRQRMLPRRQLLKLVSSQHAEPPISILSVCCNRHDAIGKHPSDLSSISSCSNHTIESVGTFTTLLNSLTGRPSITTTTTCSETKTPHDVDCLRLPTSPFDSVSQLGEKILSRSLSISRSSSVRCIIGRKCGENFNLLSSCLHNNRQMYYPKVTMFPINMITRLASTMQKSITTNGSGVPIENDQENLLSNPKGNKQIKINACGELYTELSKTRPSLYGNAPKKLGIDFNLRYYDSLELLDPVKRPLAPIVCLLHGAPGHYKDFVSLINYLTSKGVRVLAPSFPDYSATFKHSFRHSPRERADYLLKFFEALKLKKIDLLIGHSSAVYTLFELLDHSLTTTNGSRIRVNSLGLFNTPSYNLPSNLAVTPFRLFTLKLFDYPLVRPLISALIHTFVRFQGIRNRVDQDRLEDLLIAASAVGYSECEKMENYLKLVQTFSVPTFVLIGGNDKLIPMRCYEQLKRDLGVFEEKQVKLYNDRGELVKDDTSKPNDIIRVSQFSSGGHYTFQRFSCQVNEDVHKFLTRVVLERQVETTKL